MQESWEELGEGQAFQGQQWWRKEIKMSWESWGLFGEEDPLNRCPKICPLGPFSCRPASGRPGRAGGRPRKSTLKNRPGRPAPGRPGRGWPASRRNRPQKPASAQPGRPRPGLGPAWARLAGIQTKPASKTGLGPAWPA